MKDYYSILRVSRGADVQIIKQSYRRLVQQYHPDINPDPKAADLIKEINEAYDVLSDPVKKNDYDLRLLNPDQQQVPQSPQPAHRDPRYRRSNVRRGTSSDYYTQEELMQQYLPYMLWICRIGILFVVVLFS